MAFSLISILVSTASIVPSEGPYESIPKRRKNLNLHSFSNTRPILDLKVSLDLEGPLWDTPWPQKPLICFHRRYLEMFSLKNDFISICSIWHLKDPSVGLLGLKTILIYIFM